MFLLRNKSGNNVKAIQDQQQTGDSNARMEDARVEALRQRNNSAVATLRPRGEQWMSISSDYDGARRLPRTLQSLDDADDLDFELSPAEMLTDYSVARKCGYVEAICLQNLVGADALEQIEKDLPRTFPDVDYFANTDVQHSLRRILVSVASEFEAIGYVQGMNFIAAHLLIHTRSEDAAFLLFCRLMEHPKFNLHQVFSTGLPKVLRYSKVLDALANNHIPDLREHFNKVGLEPLYYAQRWIITLFTYTMPFCDLAEVWDYFFQIGWEALFRVCIVLLKAHETRLLRSDLDHTARILRELVDDPPQGLCTQAECLQLSEWEQRLVADSVAVDEDTFE